MLLLLISISGDFFYEPEYFCHPNDKMNSKTLDDAKRECLTDPLCPMFYKVCGDEGNDRFRKCNETAYEEASGCTDVVNFPTRSKLYKKGNVIVIWCG